MRTSSLLAVVYVTLVNDLFQLFLILRKSTRFQSMMKVEICGRYIWT